MIKRPVSTPRVKFSFTTPTARDTALEKVHNEHPQLMTSVAEDPAGTFYLFVQSVCSNIFDMRVRHLIESEGGTYLALIR